MNDDDTRESDDTTVFPPDTMAAPALAWSTEPDTDAAATMAAAELPDMPDTMAGWADAPLPEMPPMLERWPWWVAALVAAGIFVFFVFVARDMMQTIPQWLDFLTGTTTTTTGPVPRQPW